MHAEAMGAGTPNEAVRAGQCHDGRALRGSFLSAQSGSESAAEGFDLRLDASCAPSPSLG